MFQFIHRTFFHSNRRFTHSYVLKMNKAYLRCLDNNEHFHITFLYQNTERNVNRQFNFTRRLTENVESFVSRVVTNVDKVVNKKKKTEKVEVSASLFLDDEEVSADTVCKDLFLDNNKVKLKLLGDVYDVVVNSPYVDNLILSSSILNNFPTYPIKIESVYTDLRLSSFEWFTSTDKNNWEFASKGFIYTPSKNDIGKYLKLIFTTKNETAVGPAIESISPVKIDKSPDNFPFEKRQQYTVQNCGKNEFRVVTYNILADLYCDSDFTRTVLHPYCPPYALHIDYRKQLIIKELIGYNADVICLQELDRKIYQHELKPVLDFYDYDSNFSLKGGTVAEGLCCFFRKNKFEMMESSNILLSEEVKLNTIFTEVWNKLSENPKLSERFLDRQTVMQVTVLRNKDNNNIVIVGNTHLYFHPDADHIRLIQGIMCIQYLQHTYNEIKNKYDKQKVATIFCGDFNSTPECGIYKLYTQSELEASCIDWKSNEEETVPGLSVKQSFDLGSACGTPKYTNYTSGFADCLDYIFYDKSQLKVIQSVPLPSLEELTEHTALPSIVFPSDHISLIADFKYFV